MNVFIKIYRSLMLIDNLMQVFALSYGLRSVAPVCVLSWSAHRKFTMERQGSNLDIDESTMTDALDPLLHWPTKTKAIGQPVIYLFLNTWGQKVASC